MSAVGATAPVLGVTDDEHLVAAVRRGDDRAFDELYSRYGGRIVSYVLGMVGDHGRSEDIAQEVFISALRRMRATEGPIAFKPWVYEIAKNACIDEFRRTRRTKEIPLESDDDRDSSSPALVSRGPTPDAALERRLQLDDLRGAFRGLSDNHHKILVLRELEGLSYTQIGQRMGMSRSVVESTLFRARRRLGQEYEDISSGRRCEQVHGVIDAGGPSVVRALGVRERRRLARHVAHCQPCRRYAWAAGVDETMLKPASIAEKIAALLPIPAFLRWRRHGADADAARASSSHSMASLQTASQTATQLAGPGSPAAGLGRVAAAIAAVAVAGGGVAAGISSQHASKPAHHKHVAASAGGGQHGVARTHRTAAPVIVRTTKPTAHASAKATTGSTRSSSTSTTSSTGGSTTSAQPVAHSSLTSSATSASTSGTTSKIGSLLQSTASTPSKPQLPPPPKVDTSSVSSTVNNVTKTVSSTVNSTVGTVSNTLGQVKNTLGGG
jgi:RNA polymerase sigma factor (sigma-70 family)